MYRISQMISKLVFIVPYQNDDSWIYPYVIIDVSNFYTKTFMIESSQGLRNNLFYVISSENRF